MRYVIAFLCLTGTAQAQHFHHARQYTQPYFGYAPSYVPPKTYYGYSPYASPYYSQPYSAYSQPYLDYSQQFTYPSYQQGLMPLYPSPVYTTPY